MLAISALRVVIDPDTERRVLDLRVHVPGLPEALRGQAGFIALDTILGEESVERWLGEIEFTGDAAPPEAVDHPWFDQLLELVHPPLVSGTDGRVDLAPVQDAEAELATTFSGSCLHAASVTAGGQRRTLVYVDGDTDTATAIERWARERGLRCRRRSDPGWDAIRPFR